MTLNKSKYLKGVQCPKILWLDKHMPEQHDPSTVNVGRLEAGSVVGDVAKGYFGEYAEVAYSPDISAMVAETHRLLLAGEKVIAEAAFKSEDNSCIVDVLRSDEDGGYEIVEIKSSTASPEQDAAKVDAVYLNDLAYQVYVLKGCGLDISKVSLMQLNKDYIRRGALDISNLFVLTDCSERVFNIQVAVANKIDCIEFFVSQDSEPNELIGSRCDKPYECGFKGWCWRGLPENNVFDIGWSMWGSKKDEAYKNGVRSFQDVLVGQMKLSDKQRRQVEMAVREYPPYTDKAALEKFLSQIKYPLYHLDFETFQQPIPLWDNVSPYEQIPFQYSLHIQKTACGLAKHKEFLGKEGIDPRRELVERLCNDIPMGAYVMAYYATFEKTQIKALADQFKDKAAHLMSIHDNMIDLAVPFQSGAYYCREMGGSYSIKVVLPALCPDDPELNYKALNLIHNGAEAMSVYAMLHEKDADEIEIIRAALLAYCRLDTLAMVKILEKLYMLVGYTGVSCDAVNKKTIPA